MPEAIESDNKKALATSDSRCIVCGLHTTTHVHGAALATLCERYELSEHECAPWPFAESPITEPTKP